MQISKSALVAAFTPVAIMMGGCAVTSPDTKYVVSNDAYERAAAKTTASNLVTAGVAGNNPLLTAVGLSTLRRMDEKLDQAAKDTLGLTQSTDVDCQVSGVKKEDGKVSIVLKSCVAPKAAPSPVSAPAP